MKKELSVIKHTTTFSLNLGDDAVSESESEVIDAVNISESELQPTERELIE